MNFLIQFPHKRNCKKIRTFNTSVRLCLKGSPGLNLFIFDLENKNLIKEIENTRYKYIFLGDIIVDKEKEGDVNSFFEKIAANFTPGKIKYLKGFFYIIQIDKVKQILRVFNSVFSILPIYYYQADGYYLVSSRLDLIKENSKQVLRINEKFVLEKTLFNYPLFNDTLFSEIRTVPANSYIQIEKKIQLKKHTDITDYYVSSPKPWRKSLNEMSNLFLETVKGYYPGENFFISFTGGFDGRTLVAAAKKYKKDFAAYSYGTADCADIVLPKEHCEKINVPFLPVYLDRSYVENQFFESGLELIEKTEGNAAFSRAHYVYAAKLLSSKTSFIVTGNFGSELFRTIHNMPITGLIISRELIEIYKQKDERDWINFLKNSPRLNYLNMPRFNLVFEELIQEIIEYKNQGSNLTLNQNFYRFVFEELFRKYFGPEIILQSYFLCNRTPFLNFKFIEKLLKTGLSGVYDNFFEENPIKRFKGQVLYAHIIKKSFPGLLKYRTDRGYKPVDLLTPIGKFNILKSFIRKRLFRTKKSTADLQKVNESFLFNADSWKSFNIADEFYNKEYLEKKFLEKESIKDANVFTAVLSTNWFLRKMMA